MFRGQTKRCPSCLAPTRISWEHTMPLLEVNDVHTYYGNIQALKGISLTVEQGEIVTLIGSNGAGKTTTLRTIAGVLRPRKGTVRMGDRDLTKVPANEIVRLGLAHSPEGRR